MFIIALFGISVFVLMLMYNELADGPFQVTWWLNLGELSTVNVSIEESFYFQERDL